MRWSERESAWLEDLEDDTVTHEITWRPTFRVRVAIPPWQDPEDACAELTMAWNDMLTSTDDGMIDQVWFDTGTTVRHWITVVENDGSTQSIAGWPPPEA